MISIGAEDYARAESMLAPYRKQAVPGASVAPQWLAGGRRFVYEVGGRHVLVDPATGTRRDAFDHARLAAALSLASGHAVDAADLPVMLLEFELPGRDEDVVRFFAFGENWEFSGDDGTCERVEGPGLPSRVELVSPDKAWAAFTRDGNIWVRSQDGGEEFALTEDAEPDHSYGAMLDWAGIFQWRALGIDPPFVAEWSPDSTRLLTHRLDQRGLPEQVLVESAPAGGGRPVEHRLRYPVPGDEQVATMSWVVLDVAARTVVHQQDPPTPIVHTTSRASRWWVGDSVYFLRYARDALTLEMHRLDPATGASTLVVQETGRTCVDPGASTVEPAQVQVLDSGEILWWSQRDGWGHLYLSSPDGGKHVQVTSGEWLVRRVLWVDEDARRVWFLANGLDETDPYLRQICRIDLDGTGFTRLTDDEFDHDAISPPEGGYVVDRASTVATPPRSSVLDGDGRVLVELEAPDTAALASRGWAPPERFRATAADGRTPVYGLLWRPHGFDPDRRYPVIDHVYPGPMVYRASPAFDAPPFTGEAEALAALGFAVVAVDGRGTAGRSKAFHDHSYRNFSAAGFLVDHVAAIRQLGERHPWLDTARVGITGSSGGGYATTRALLAHPEFFGVGVARATPNDIGSYYPYWGERYYGDLDDDARRDLDNAHLAANLQGRLLLIHGELDDNVLPAQSLRLVDALVKADKDVDMLVVPGAEHLFNGSKHYVLRRTWDYFVRHLHGAEPPSYRLTPLPPSLPV
ncbi:S9 family peptidase [Pseudonocardia kunmingensis]|uniref:Dipeptidyl aminopeptidase/acylaminoacyl peptidase n=1 Tax=Pseudonocardia kunmingensis TaxID=630975 RepID=A0A543DIY9_9PSEU|nr:DPP IV N-terminal domain-containing protein [Pseudonocardia kunmingensis]TQM09300.1 dipeptidyl aminopeptidase/acylaminoacyl peptidase [Pseudonocardia kunmingensis]